VKKIKEYVQGVVLVALLLFTIGFCWINRASLAKIFQLSSLDLISIFGAYFFCYLVNAAMASHQLKRRAVEAPVWQILVINCHSSLLGYMTVLRLGYYSGKAYFYQRLYGVPITTSIGMMGLLSLLTIATTAVLGIFLGMWAVFIADLAIPLLYWAVLLASILLCVLLVAALSGLVWGDWLPRRIQLWVTNVHTVFVETRARETAVLTGLAILSLVFQVIAFWVLFTGFGLPLPLIYIAFLAVFSSLSLIISLTPANLGVREFIIWLMVSHLDISSVDIISVMLVDRILQVLLVIAISLLGHRTVRLGKQAAA
jgi:uncharacterized membrane protein YbhN (UPF0104 family)